MAVTPTRNCLCAQDDLEPVLRRFAEDSKLGELRFSTELTALTYDDKGVSAVLLDRTSNTVRVIRARYLIAADGAQSRVRRQLGARMVGEERIYDSVNILFHADLTQWVEHRPAALYFIEQPELRGTFLTINGTDRWGFLIHSLEQYGFKPEDFTPEHLHAAGAPGRWRARTCRCRSSVSRRGWPRRSSPTAIATARSSSPATRRTRCRPQVASG